MHPRIEEVINYLDTERTALREGVESVPPDLRDKQPGADRLSVAQVLQHLLIIEKRIGLVMTKWVTDASTGGNGTEGEASSVMNNLPLELNVDRSQRKIGVEKVRPARGIEGGAA